MQVVDTASLRRSYGPSRCPHTLIWETLIYIIKIFPDLPDLVTYPLGYDSYGYDDLKWSRRSGMIIVSSYRWSREGMHRQRVGVLRTTFWRMLLRLVQSRPYCPYLRIRHGKAISQVTTVLTTEGKSVCTTFHRLGISIPLGSVTVAESNITVVRSFILSGFQRNSRVTHS